MKFCTNCGNKLSNTDSSCPKCGYNFNFRENDTIINSNINSKKKEVSSNDVSTNSKKVELPSNNISDNFKEEIAFQNNLTPPLKVKKTLSKGSKIKFLLVVIIISVITSFYIIGKDASDPNNVIKKFSEAVSSNNKKELLNILCSEDSRLKLNETTITPLLDYLKNNPSYFNDLTVSLSDDAMKIKNSGAFKGNSNNIFSLSKSGNQFLFFPSYKIYIKAAFFSVSTPIKDVSLSFADTSLGTSSNDNFTKEFGPFVPGKYKLSANYKGKYVTLNKNYDVNLITTDNSKPKVKVFDDVSYVTITSDRLDAKIFVDGRDSKTCVSSAKNFGPLIDGTKIYAISKENNKNLKSKEYTYSSGDKDIVLDFSAAESKIENTKSDLHSLIDLYTSYFCQAVNTGDFSYVEPYIYPSSSFYSSQKDYTQNTYNKNIKEDIMSFKILSFNTNEDDTEGTVTTEEVYKVYTNTDDYNYSSEKSSIKTFKYTYSFKYNEKTSSYQLCSISSNK